ncbi:MAG: hypothetical protein AAGN82_16030 [Myxococcota bacterium]
MSALLYDHRDALPQHHLRFFAGSAVVVQHPSFLAAFDQVVDDALGPSRGPASRLRCAQQASRPLLKRLVHRMLPTSPAQRLDIARQVFAALGLGQLSLDVTPAGGRARVRHPFRLSLEPATTGGPGRPWPLDAIAGGFAGAATEVAFDLPSGLIAVVPEALGPEGSFRLDARGTAMEVRTPHQAQIRELVPSSFGGLHEDRIAERSIDALARIEGAAGDDRGDLRDRDQRLAFVPADYGHALTHHLLATVTEEKPKALPAARALLAEAGYTHAFLGLGRALAAGGTALAAGGRSPLEVLVDGLAVARAWGWGRWCVEVFVPEERLVLRSPGTPESLYVACTVEGADRPQAHALEGAGVALMDLAHRTEWTPTPNLDARTVTANRRAPTWTATVTHSVAVGDPVDRVVVQRIDGASP